MICDRVFAQPLSIGPFTDVEKFLRRWRDKTRKVGIAALKPERCQGRQVVPRVVAEVFSLPTWARHTLFAAWFTNVELLGKGFLVFVSPVIFAKRNIASFLQHQAAVRMW